MRVVLAPDSFKESMTAAEAAEAMARGVREVYPDAECILKPLADGGEGTVAALAPALSARLISVDTQDAVGQPLRADIGLTPTGTAIIEAASVIGLARLRPEQRRIEAASSLGLAALLRAALDAGAHTVIVGLGGTASCDGGAGLLVGLGARLLDQDHERLPANPSGLARLAEVDLDGLDPRLARCTIIAASDVTNPLLGEHGAAAVFGPQKGATMQQVPWLDSVLTRWADAMIAAGAVDVRDRAGAGAAGGLGAALLMVGAELRSGLSLVAEAIGLEAAIAGADLVLTGEGSLDAQTAAGKAPLGVLRLATEVGVPVLAFAGRIPDRAAVADLGFAELVALSEHRAVTRVDMEQAPQRLQAEVSAVLRRRRDAG